MFVSRSYGIHTQRNVCMESLVLYRYDISAIDTMLSNFIVPLQQMVDEEGRVHCSLNLNTETGRLSARRPNLQNQPALEKDRYKVREAFRAKKGCKLIVADYGQLELRILAHMVRFVVSSSSVYLKFFFIL